MQMVDINSLVLDYDIYPRCSIDTQHAYYMVESLKSGADLPPVIVDKKSKRVIDGFHRITAIKRYNKTMGITNAKIAAVLKTYKNESQMFIDSMKYNASHGVRLNTADRAHCLIKSEMFQISIEDVSKALSISIDRCKTLKKNRVGKQIAFSSRLSKRGKPANVPIPLKRTIAHMAGDVLNAAQVEANSRLSGMNQSFYANQLITLIESGLLNRNDEYLMERLDHLMGLLNNLIGTKGRKAW